MVRQKNRGACGPHNNIMLPSSYQTVLRNHLNEQQYLTLEIVLLLIQAHRQVQLSTLASLFPQPIKYESRIRNLQRFLALPRLCVKVLWFPLIKYWIRQEQTGHQLNRAQRRYLKKTSIKNMAIG